MIYGWVGAVTDDGFTVAYKVAGPVDVRLAVSTSSSMTSPTYSGTEVDADGWHKLSITGLSANTEYYWALEEDSVLGSAEGSIFTLPTEGVAANFSVAAASCCTTGTNANTFSRIETRRPAFFMHMGDFHYNDITTNNTALYESAIETQLALSNHASLYKNVPVFYCWDDHDYADNNSDSTATGRPAALTTYRKVVPHPPLAASGADNDTPISSTWVCGRVRFVQLDIRSEADLSGTAGNGSLLGTSQLNWLTNLIETFTEQLMVLDVSVPWIVTGGDVTATDNWGHADAEREAIANAIQTHAKGRVLIIHGDSHMVAMDDGTNTNFATTPDGPGPRLCVFAPISRTNSVKGGPYSEGTYSSSTTQYGVLQFNDDGTNITVTATGYDASDDSALVQMQFNVNSNVIVLESGSSWTVPADWNDSDNKIEVIGAGGGGGGGSHSGAAAGSGGGGGEYARITNKALTPSSSVSISIGAGGSGGTTGNDGSAGGDTWFDSTSTLLAKGGGAGVNGASASGGAGGTGGVGDTKFVGGTGGAGGAASNPGSGGGGGAGGVAGAGGAGGDGFGGGTSDGSAGGGGGGGGTEGAGAAGGSGVASSEAGGGGGGSSGGTAGASPSGTGHGDGGNNDLGTGGGTSSGQNGTSGGGGAGSDKDAGAKGGNGGSNLITKSGGGGGGCGEDAGSDGAGLGGGTGGDGSDGTVIGSGGGGGGVGGSLSAVTDGNYGGPGGRYGGGGGGGPSISSSNPSGTSFGGDGYQGVIVITYTPAASTTVTGSGALQAQTATMSGTTERTVTGTGALAAATATVSGVAARTFYGSGTLAAQVASVSGTIERSVITSVTLAAQTAVLSGAGTRVFTGSGAVTAQAADISATVELSGSITVSVALSAQTATTTGVVERILTGTGTLQAATAILAGSADEVFSASGALSVAAASLSATTVVARVVSGALSAQAADITGAGLHYTTAAGAMNAQRGTLSVQGVVARIVSGSLSAQLAGITGAGSNLSLVSGTGALVAQPATMTGGNPMAIAPIGATKGTANSASPTVSLHGSAQAGDFALLVITADGTTNTITPPSGFTQLFMGISPSSAIGDKHVYVGYKILGSSEPSSFVASLATADDHAISCTIFRAFDQDTPIDAALQSDAVDGGGGGLPACPSITTQTDGAALINIVCDPRGPLFGDMDFENYYQPPAGITELIDANYNAGTSYAGHAVGYQIINTAGSTGTRTWTSIDNNDGGLAMSFALMPLVVINVTGSGALTAQAATLSGAGIRTSNATANIAASTAVLDGIADVDGTVQGNGALLAGPAVATMSVSLFDVITGAGALVAGNGSTAATVTTTARVSHLTSVEYVYGDTASPSIEIPPQALERDIVFAVQTCDGSSSVIALPAEFTTVFNGDVPNTAVSATKLAVGYRVLDGSEPQLLTFTQPGGEDATISLSVFRGLDRDEVFDVAITINTEEINTNPLPPCLGVTTVTENVVLLTVVSQARGPLFVDMDFDNYYQPPAGHTEIVDVNRNAGSSYTGHAVGYEELGAAGPTGNRQWSSIYGGGTNGGGLAILMALKPDSDPKATITVDGAMQASTAVLTVTTVYADVSADAPLQAEPAVLTGVGVISTLGSVNIQAEDATATGAGTVTPGPRLASGAMQAQDADVVVGVDNLVIVAGTYDLEFVQLGWWVTDTATLVLEEVLIDETIVEADLGAGPATMSLAIKTTINARGDLQASPAVVETYPWIEHHPDDDQWVPYDPYWNE